MLSQLRHLIAAAALAAFGLTAGPAPAAAQAPERPLVLETIELEGATRTHRATALHAFPLREGDEVTPTQILDAVAALRDAELFSSVDFRTSRGTERGRFVLHLIVVESGVELRFGTGYRDLDGWYLIPAQLRLDNRLGRGERFRLQAKLGYRTSGVEFIADDPQFGDGRNAWELMFAGYGVDQPYFLDGVEYRHSLGRGSLGFRVSRDLGPARVGVGWTFEVVDPDSSARAFEDDPFRGISRGERLEFADLPSPVASVVGERRRSVFHAQVVHDSRARRLRASTPVSGVWGKLRTASHLYEDGFTSHGAVTVDLRAYRATVGGALALRLRGGAVGDAAPFYDRFHLGGLYTIRGYPTQSLSPPEGDTRFWTASVEYRAPLVGRPDRPRLLGFLFLDVGDGWERGNHDANETAAAVGWGLRLTVPWIDSLGADFGIPVGPSSVDEAFHANAAIGWNF
ncbi:MAG: BamA/TamA family outer membrane protein [Gemmatimonadetes bacterium]|nr:BamA/TamA family outer membrane protein [Gemmatimonadota bacterium]